MNKTIVILSALIISTSVHAQVLNVMEVQQEHNQWCWAGVSSSILDYYCTPTDQCDIAEYTRTVATWYDYGAENCCENPNAGCNYVNYAWGYSGSIQDILYHFGDIQSNGVSSYLTHTQLKASLMNNKLFVIRWGWVGGGGHFVLGHGVVDSQIYYMDPWYGEGYKIANYSWVKNGGSHQWTHTLRIQIEPDESIPFPYNIDGDELMCIGESVDYSVDQDNNLNEYTWSIPSDWEGQSNSNSISCIAGESDGEISVIATNDCGSSLPTSISVSPSPVPETPIITQSENLLTSSVESGNCWNNQDGIIDGATNQEFLVTETGSYYVIIDQLGCPSQPSNIIDITLNVEQQNLIVSNFSIYPNPFIDCIHLKSKNIDRKITYSICNMLGEKLISGEFQNAATIDLSHLSKGTYILRSSDGSTIIINKQQ